MISVVFPAYNEEKNVGELHRQLVSVFNSMNIEYEIIAVENGSKDNTKEELLKLSPIKMVRLAYNAGQTSALDAGIQSAKGDLIVIMDGDLQNDPLDIPVLLAKMKEGYDGVVGWRKDRNDSFGRRIFSRAANLFTRKITGLDIHDFGCALRIFKRSDLKNIRLYGVMHVFIPVILSTRGARITEVEVRHHERKHGSTKYTFLHMFTDIADLLTIKFLYLYANRPLLFFGGWGLASLFVAFIFIVWSFYMKYGSPDLGFSQTPLPIFASLFVILGFLLFMIGFLAELLIRIYYEARRETPYEVSEVVEQ
jgi:glycosyltransferase involved in cell wall biosynthesis